MRDLIDRNKLKERLFPVVPDPRGVSKAETSLYMQGWNDAITSIIQNEPSAEPEIIRCKDCKNRDADDFCTGRGYPNGLVPDDGFCDKGERREVEVRV